MANVQRHVQYIPLGVLEAAKHSCEHCPGACWRSIADDADSFHTLAECTRMLHLRHSLEAGPAERILYMMAKLNSAAPDLESEETEFSSEQQAVKCKGRLQACERQTAC